MKRLGLVRTLKGTILFLAAMAALCYAKIFPDAIVEMGRQTAGVSWLVTPGVIAVSVSAVPIAIALGLFWMICTEVGRDNSFCYKNAKLLSGIGFCALIDTGYCAAPCGFWASGCAWWAWPSPWRPSCSATWC